MIANKNLLFVTLSVILILTAFVGTATAQREYHLGHEWAKIWINQDGSIDLLYDISITLDSGPNINYVYLGQPKRDFTIGTAMDQYGNTLDTSDASSGSDYKVQINLHEPLMAGQTLRFNVTTNVAQMIYKDTAENVGIKFTPTWWEEASVSDLQVQIVLPPGVKVENVTTTEELWDGTPLEGDRLSVFWQRANLLPNQKYTFGVSFPKEFVQEYTSGIYILPDGSIDPPTENISTVDYFTYTFVGNIYDSIVVERDNIAVDGTGYTLQGIGSGVGLNLTARSNVTIKNTEIRAFEYGIWLNMSSSIHILGNNITENIGWSGIYLVSSFNNMVSGNNITNNTVGVSLIYSSGNNTVSENNITNNGSGVSVMFSSDNNTVSENNITNNEGIGISLTLHSNNNTISGNNITNNNFGVYLLSSSDNNTVSENNITNNDSHGVYLVYSSGNMVSGNNITNNGSGVSVMLYSGNNMVSGNNITNNGFGIYLDDSSDNRFYYNNLINNTDQVYSESSVNIWDDGISKGNYWGDYKEKYPNAEEIDGSGIWDTPYDIDENNQDNYPIVPEFPTWTSMLLILILLTAVIVIYKRRLLKTPTTKQPSSKNVSMTLGPKLTFSIVLSLK